MAQSNLTRLLSNATRWAVAFLLVLSFSGCRHGSSPASSTSAAHAAPTLPAIVRRVTDYDLSVRIDPSSGRLEGEALLRTEGIAPGTIELFLNRNFVIESVMVDGRATSFTWDDSGRALPYVSVARAFRITPAQVAKGAREIRVRYAGRVEGVLADVNMVGPQLVELAIYAAYYPMLNEMGTFPSTVRITIPSDFTIVSRGERVQTTIEGDRRIETWHASIPGSDIPIVASAQLRTESMRSGAVDVAVFFRDLRPENAREALREAVATLDYLTREFGPPPANALRVAFSPRGGWGYSRTGLIVVSEQRHLRRASDESSSDPPDQNLHGNAHEISHFWWHVASTQGPDDWINEALAEFSAAKDSHRRDPAAYRLWAERYLRSLHSKPPPVGILATRSGDSYRYANWYERGALLFICSEAKYGEAALRRALVSLLALGQSRPVTANDVVTILGRNGIDEAWVHGWLEDAAATRAEACMATLPP